MNILTKLDVWFDEDAVCASGVSRVRHRHGARGQNIRSDDRDVFSQGLDELEEVARLGATVD